MERFKIHFFVYVIQYCLSNIDWSALEKKKIHEPLHELVAFLVIVAEGDDGVERTKDSHQDGQDDLF